MTQSQPRNNIYKGTNNKIGQARLKFQEGSSCLEVSNKLKSINRVLTKPWTKFFIGLGFHPNHITLLSGLTGISAVAFFSRGTRAGFITGALFFELFYILDNCDGEVARARGLSTKFGSWLDTIVDYCVHVLAFGGIAFGLYRMDKNPLMIIAGIAAMTGIFLSFYVVLLQKSRGYGLAIHGMPKAPVGEAKKTGFLDRMIEIFAAGDFSLVLLFFAFFNKMEVLLWLAAFGANIFCGALLAVNFKYLMAGEK